MRDTSLAIIGLGYVGLPLAVEFAKKFPTVGFDINQKRVIELQNGHDRTLEIADFELKNLMNLRFSNNLDDLSGANTFIVTVPTPIDKNNQPDMTALAGASEIIGETLKVGDLVVFESTVYPGATEEFCVPILEKCSGLVFNQDFYVGYSPERINPGDKEHCLVDIVKVVSGSTPTTAQTVDELYRTIITAGTFRASSIKVAEAAKVIENTQRDLNIALINELSIIFNKLGIETEEVLQAAGTKWNFLPFRPGLVGGHCIGVDPYYLTFKAQVAGYHPEVILAGRRVNDGMAAYVSGQLLKEMTKRKIKIGGSKVLILGMSFKENCPDIRNSKVFDIVKELIEFGMKVDCFDPWVDANEAMAEYNVKGIKNPKNGQYDAIIIAVSHNIFKEFGHEVIRNFGSKNHILYDLKYTLPAENVDLRL